MQNRGDDSHAALRKFDAAWFSDCLGEEIHGVEWDDVSAKGFVSGMKKVALTKADGNRLCLVIKIFNSGGVVDQRTIATLGCAREADFYNYVNGAGSEMSAVLEGLLPKVYFAESDWKTGEKTVVMEDLSEGGVLSGLFFGPGSPINWGKDLKALTSVCPGLAPLEITRASFLAIARLHAPFWKRGAILDIPWLMASDYFRGVGRAQWEKSMERSQTAFTEMKAKIDSGTFEYDVPKELLACLQTSFDQMSWDNFTKETPDVEWTFVHGDFHPGNVMWSFSDPNQQKVRLIDWEMVGVGSGPQELGQFVISHLDTSLYGEADHRALVKAYYEELTRINPEIGKTYGFERCFRDFAYRGFRKWLWMLPSLCKWHPATAPYFIKQMEAFRLAHGIVTSKVGFPIL